MIDTAKLREIASNATPGPWTTERPTTDASGFLCGVAIAAVMGGAKVYADPPGGQFPANDRLHIAAFNPPTVLALIDELEIMRGYELNRDKEIVQTRNQRDSARALLREAVRYLPSVDSARAHESSTELRARITAELGEVTMNDDMGEKRAAETKAQAK